MMKALLQKIKVYKLHRPAYAKKLLLDNLGTVGKLPSKAETLANTFQWIEASFKANADGGSAAYYKLGQGWKASYPETTGYLIPTLYAYSEQTNDVKWRQLALKAANWLLSIQSSEGGWQGLQVDVKADLRVFNTGMILDGLIAAYKAEKDEKFLAAAKRGFDWVLKQTDERGFFTKFNVSDGGSFDTLVVSGLLMVYDCLAEEEKQIHHNKIMEILDAHVSLQQENGWFERCNFSSSYKQTALLHHIGYTLDGLILSSQILKEKKYYDAAKKTAKKLLSKFEVNLELPAYVKADWSTFKDLKGKKASLCLTGYSQIAIVFQRIYETENDLRYLNAALKIVDIVAAIGNHKSTNNGLCYGLAGSYPLNGNYQSYQIVNWAAKYHADATLMAIKNTSRD